MRRRKRQQDPRIAQAYGGEYEDGELAGAELPVNAPHQELFEHGLADGHGQESAGVSAAGVPASIAVVMIVRRCRPRPC